MRRGGGFYQVIMFHGIWDGRPHLRDETSVESGLGWVASRLLCHTWNYLVYCVFPSNEISFLDFFCHQSGSTSALWRSMKKCGHKRVLNAWSASFMRVFDRGSAERKSSRRRCSAFDSMSRRMNLRGAVLKIAGLRRK